MSMVFLQGVRFPCKRCASIELSPKAVIFISVYTRDIDKPVSSL